jgi:excinuclease ABC subunit A
LRDLGWVEKIILDGKPWDGEELSPAEPHDLDLHIADLSGDSATPTIRQAVGHALGLGVPAVVVSHRAGKRAFSCASVCLVCGTWLGDLRPVDFNSRCVHCDGKGCARCDGSGLPAQAAAVRWQGLRFPELLALAVDDAQGLFSALEAIPAQARLLSEILRRLEALQRVGLGYITLDRPSPSLSRGEAQRVRLAVALVSRLEDMLHVLDEPTVGQHPADIQRLLPAFRDLAGPVVFVEHERLAAAQADNAIDLGPGAGTQGGRVIFSGTARELWLADTPTGRYFSLRYQSPRPAPRPEPHDFLTVHQADLRNLQGIDIPIPLSRLTVVTGVSGSGKSTLVEDVLVASLANGTPNGCRAISGPALKPVLVDQSPIGRNPRSNPATYTKLADIVRDILPPASGLTHRTSRLTAREAPHL